MTVHHLFGADRRVIGSHISLFFGCGELAFESEYDFRVFSAVLTVLIVHGVGFVGLKIFLACKGTDFIILFVRIA